MDCKSQRFPCLPRAAAAAEQAQGHGSALQPFSQALTAERSFPGGFQHEGLASRSVSLHQNRRPAEVVEEAAQAVGGRSPK